MLENGDSIVRNATADDAREVARLLHAFNTEFGEPSPGEDALAARVPQLLDNDTSILLAGDGPDGLAVLRFRLSIWTPGLESYLAELYVRPERRGRGLGRALMQSAIALARERGADGMDLGTDEGDTVAHALYESLGFSRTNGRPDGETSYFYELNW